MPTMRAAVFINWGMPMGMGHVGWGFEKVPGQFYFGAVEVTDSLIKGKGLGQNKLFNSYKPERDMLKAMKTGQHGGSGFIYHEYKYINVKNPDLAAPIKLIQATQKAGYGLIGNNCMDAVFNVIKAYANGDDKILPWPMTHWSPRSFYSDIPTKSVVLQKEKGFWGFWQ